jgi:radical SAM protein with 4Fe4S-binding SPASM domain
VEDISEVSAVVQPRIHSAKKVSLEDQIPLRTPFSAHIDVCSVCNYKCSFCFQADNPAMKAAGLKRGMMDVDLFKKIVDGVADFDEKLKKIKIGNHGEPTLHPKLPEMIRYARDADCADIIEVFTNGSKLNPELNEAMVKAGLQRINISLEGLTNERYWQVAGIKEDVDAMYENLVHLYEVSRGSDLQIYIKIADRTSALDNNDERIFILSEEERQYFFDRFGNICDEIFIEKIVPQWAETQYDKQNSVGETGMYDQKIKTYKDICPFIFMYLHFNWDGTVSPCTLDWPKKVNIGNSKEESTREIWDGESLRSLQIAMLRGERDKINFCNNCSAPMVCVEEDLDNVKPEMLELLGATNEEITGDNIWIMPSTTIDLETHE